MRDTVVIPFTQEESLVITSDNSGAIGMKEQDAVKVAYDIVSYYSFRVAVMECMASGATPISVVVQNFCGNEPWDKLIDGVQRGLTELNLDNIPITGSTESNFSLSQSAFGINVIGKKTALSGTGHKHLQNLNVALIGLPLVGNEVVTQADVVAPLSVFKEICALQDVLVWPVGSKGVLHEIKRMLPDLNKDEVTSSKVDLLKSGGPSTSFLITYPSGIEGRIMQFSGKHFNKLWEELS